MVNAYRIGAEVDEDMSVSEIAKKIQETYAKRLGRNENIKVTLSMHRCVMLPKPSELHLENKKYKEVYSACLCYGNCPLTSVTSNTSFEEAINTLAQQLDVR